MTAYEIEPDEDADEALVAEVDEDDAETQDTFEQTTDAEAPTSEIEASLAGLLRPRKRIAPDEQGEKVKADVIAAAEAFCAAQGITYERIQFISLTPSAKFDALCYLYFASTDATDAIARSLMVNVPGHENKANKRKLHAVAA